MNTRWFGAVAAAALAAVPATLLAAESAAPAVATAGAPASVLLEAPRQGAWGFDLAGRDTATSPAGPSGPTPPPACR